MAGSMKDIKLRIKSVESTMQITKAMELVASSKMRRAKERVEHSRPYFETLHETLTKIAAADPRARNPYLRRDEVKRTLLIVIAGDRGLAGGYNSNVLKQAGPVPGTILHQTIEQNHELEKALDNKLIELAQPALEHKEPVRIEMPIRNVNRTVGTMVGYEITRRYGEEGLPDDTIDMTLHGSGGQSIGAFIPRGETMRIYGEVNDYAGKGLSGGRMIVRPEDNVTFDKHSNVIAGNVTGFGATSGQMFVAGRAGERFGVRNGGATFVVEGVGDHGCEYMTGGTVVVLGPTGRNFGAGFSGGNTYVLDLDMKKVNPGAIKSGALLFKSLDAETSKLVYALVKQHAEETGSQFAAALLEDWNETVKRFTHVVPKQFVAMTKAMEEAKTNNVDFNAPGAWEKVYEQVMEGAR